MSETETATSENLDIVEGTETSTDEPQGKPAETDWKAEARKWEARAKASKADSEDAQKWREYEQAQKPAQERLAEELAQAKAQAEMANASLLRYEIATERGISGEATKLLKGTSREELEAEADLLVSLLASQTKTTSPKPDHNQGKPATGGSSTADQFAAALTDIL